MTGRNKAFTLVELLVVISIIGVLIGITVPAINVALTHAKTGAMKAKINAVSSGLEMYKNDYGDYPDSSPRFNANDGYHALTLGGGVDTNTMDVGAQRLAEAMLGLDYLGFQADHYYATAPNGTPIDASNRETKRTAYLSLDEIEVAHMAERDPGDTVVPLPQDVEFGSLTSYQQMVWNNPNPVISDNFKATRPRPLLYYKARSYRNSMLEIYPYYINNNPDNPGDNSEITDVFGMIGDAAQMPADMLQFRDMGNKYFYGMIWNPETGLGNNLYQKSISSTARPYKPDSFLLISAGPDGEYGTADDVANFDVKKTY